MELTKQLALKLSIFKWLAMTEEYKIGLYWRTILENINKDLYIKIRSCLNECSLCEKYLSTKSKTLDRCADCPIRPKLKNYNDINALGCLQHHHPFRIGMIDREECAKAVLDLLTSTWVKLYPNTPVPTLKDAEYFVL
jgi:hypothetical protein